MEKSLQKDFDEAIEKITRGDTSGVWFKDINIALVDRDSYLRFRLHTKDEKGEEENGE